MGDNISTCGDNISTVGDNISTMEGIQYCEGIPSVLWWVQAVHVGIPSVLWRLFSTVGDNISTVLWRVFSTLGAFSTCRG